jgi:hypothetical protein
MGIDWSYYERTMYEVKRTMYGYRLKNDLAYLVVFRKRPSLGQHGIDDVIKTTYLCIDTVYLHM